MMTLRPFFKFLLGVLIVMVLATIGFVGWLEFYSGDLPDVSSLAAFAPTHPQDASANICGNSVRVLARPSADTVKLRAAVLAAEGEYDSKGILRRYYEGVPSQTPVRRYGHYSDQLARQLLCGASGTNLKQSFTQIRETIQLERHFSPDQMLDIYLNRAFFGQHIYGGENAAQYYFGKPSTQLSVSEAALLAALIQRPMFLSPERHSDRALVHRNDVIDTMSDQGSITPEEAEAAKKAPLGIVQH